MVLQRKLKGELWSVSGALQKLPHSNSVLSSTSVEDSVFFVFALAVKASI